MPQKVQTQGEEEGNKLPSLVKANSSVFGNALVSANKVEIETPNKVMKAASADGSAKEKSPSESPSVPEVHVNKIKP